MARLMIWDLARGLVVVISLVVMPMIALIYCSVPVVDPLDGTIPFTLVAQSSSVSLCKQREQQPAQ